MFHVFKSANGTYTYGTELRGRESVYSAPSLAAIDRFIRKAKTTLGASVARETSLPADSLNGRGNVASMRKDAYMSVGNLRTTTTDHIPARRVA
jgi:hypothetical protein